MKLGVIADSHLRGQDERVFAAFAAAFADCDAIVHAGDFVTLAVAEFFAGRQFIAVSGNVDGREIRERFPPIQKWEIGARRIILVHDLAILPREELRSADCIIFGHTHSPANIVNGGVTFFNPGSSSNNRFAGDKTVGILAVDNAITGSIVKINPSER